MMMDEDPADHFGPFVLDPSARRLDWNLLRTFIVIVQERNLTKAANRLLLTQPAITASLKKLESQMGVRLIDRGGRAFSVTGEGKALYAECLAIYSQVAAIPARLDAVQRRITGTVSMAVASGAASDILNDTIAPFHRDFPDVALSVNIASSLNAIQAVRSQVVSLGICYAQSEIEGLTYDLLRRVRFGLYCGPTHPFFGRTDIDTEALRGALFVSFQTDPLAEDRWPRDLLRFQRRMAFRTIGSSFNLSEVYRMVVSGMGVGLFPISAVAPESEFGRLWPLPMFDEALIANVHLVTNPAKRWTSAERAFIDAVRSGAHPDTPATHRAPLGSRD